MQLGPSARFGPILELSVILGLRKCQDYCRYNNLMEIEFDEQKNKQNLKKHG